MNPLLSYMPTSAGVKSHGSKGLELHLLGAVSVFVDGRRVGNLPPKALGVLILLAVEAPRRFSREYLASFFWPHLDSERARNNLRRVLHVLRSALKGGGGGATPVLLADRGFVQFNPEADWWCDVKCFLESAPVHAPADSAVAERIADLENWIALYRGELFGGPFYWLSDDFGEWETVLRENVKRRAKFLCNQLIRCVVEAGDEPRIVRCAERYLAIDPDEPGIYRQLAERYSGVESVGAVLDL